MNNLKSYNGYVRAQSGQLTKVTLKCNEDIDIHHHLHNHALTYRAQCDDEGYIYPVLAVVNGGVQ